MGHLVTGLTVAEWVFLTALLISVSLVIWALVTGGQGRDVNKIPKHAEWTKGEDTTRLTPRPAPRRPTAADLRRLPRKEDLPWNKP